MNPDDFKKTGYRPTRSLDETKLPIGGTALQNISYESKLAVPNRLMSQVFLSWKDIAGTATIILNGSYPDIIGEIFEVGEDYVAVRIENPAPLRYIPYASITEFWFEPLDKSI